MPVQAAAELVPETSAAQHPACCASCLATRARPVRAITLTPRPWVWARQPVRNLALAARTGDRRKGCRAAQLATIDDFVNFTAVQSALERCLACLPGIFLPRWVIRASIYSARCL